MRTMMSCLLLLVSVATFAGPPKEGSATEQYVLKLHERKYQWMVNKQLDSLKQILDDRVVYVHSNGWTETKPEIIADLQSGKLVMNKVVITEAKARVYDGFVIVNGKGDFSVVVDGKPVDVRLLYTEVYAKRKGGWLLVSRHACKL